MVFKDKTELQDFFEKKYTIAINQNGEGVSKFGDNYINRYKRTADYPQGIV